jgi:hypothetical protein
LEEGNAEPLPWWVEYFWASDRMQCQPWDLEPDVPRGFWRRCALILASAESEAREIVQERHAVLQRQPH